MALESYPDGMGLHLGVVVDGIPSEAQRWVITALGSDYFTLSNVEHGPTLSMEVLASPTDPFLGETRDTEGQRWQITGP